MLGRLWALVDRWQRNRSRARLKRRFPAAMAGIEEVERRQDRIARKLAEETQAHRMMVRGGRDR